LVNDECFAADSRGLGIKLNMFSLFPIFIS